MAKAQAKQLANPHDRRSERSRAAILRTAVAILQDEGLAPCTMDAIAQRAGFAKTTLYRQWGGRTELIEDAINLMASRGLPDTGAFHTDIFEFFDTYGRPLMKIDAAAALDTHLERVSDAKFAGLEHRMRERSHERLLVLVTRARDRGEINDTFDAVTITNMFIGGIMVRRIFFGLSANKEYIKAMADIFTAK